jgi:hypothetical protein
MISFKKFAQWVISKVFNCMPVSHGFRDVVQTLHEVMPYSSGSDLLAENKTFLWEAMVHVVCQEVALLGRDASVSCFMTTKFANGTALTCMPPRRSRTTVAMTHSGTTASTSNKISESLSTAAMNLVVSLALSGLSLGFTIVQYKVYKALWQWSLRLRRNPNQLSCEIAASE